MDEFNDFQLVKRRMYAMRNGVVADALRSAGAPFRIIFGVNLPQLREIAARSPHDATLAELLRLDTANRESQLIAPMLMPCNEMTPELARRWIEESTSVETIDVLCHSLLRYLPFAAELAAEALDSEADMTRYAGIRLLWNLLPTAAMMRGDIEAEAGRECALTHRVAQGLLEELDFLNEA